MPSRMVSSSQVHPEEELVPSHQYPGYQTPPNIPAQIQSAIINKEAKKRTTIKHGNIWVLNLK